MICFLWARRLRPGAYDEFRRAWEPERWPAEAIRAYHVRHKDDENLVVSFGLYEGALADLDRIREGHGDDHARLAQIGRARRGDAARGCVRSSRGGRAGGRRIDAAA
jgi:hypothetical protein